MTGRGLPAALALAVALSGCVATQRDVLDLSSQQDELKKQIVDLKQTVSSLQANQADLSVQMKQLHEDLTTFNETTKESQEQMSTLSSKLDDMSSQVTSKVASIGTTLSQQQAQSLEEQKAAMAKGSPSELFSAADVRLGLKSYDLAAKGFEDYIERFPKGALIDVAHYKHGQSLYGLNKWEKAGREFAIVLEKYPKSTMQASSRLMYAMCLMNMKKNLSEARQYLESIPADFPKSPEAKAASAQLRKLDKLASK
jgi:TolA-binding protein